MIHTQTSWPSQSSGMMMNTPLSPTVIPRMDVVETSEQLLYILEMPGVTPDKLDVEIQGSTLMVSGSSQQVALPEEQPVYHHQERLTTSFQRAIPLSSALKLEQVQAKLANGLLQISFTKQGQNELKKGQKIAVSQG